MSKKTKIDLDKVTLGDVAAWASKRGLMLQVSVYGPKESNGNEPLVELSKEPAA